MSLRQNDLTFLFGILFAGLSLPLQAADPNILFIFSDDHRYDLLGSGNPGVSTPNLDALAKSGVWFDHAFAVTPICSPSRAAVLSGRYGSRNGVPTNNAPLAFSGATFAHDLAAAGYRTAQAGKWHLETSAAEAGFQHYATIHGNSSWFEREVQTNIPEVAGGLGGAFYETFMADVVIDWISDHVADYSDQPFLMWWCNQVPHVDGRHEYPDVQTRAAEKAENRPWGSSGGYRATYDVADMPVPANWSDDLSAKPPYLSTSRFVTFSAKNNYGGEGGYTASGPGVRNATLGEDNVQQHMLEYYASVTALDAEIGRVLAFLDDPNDDGDSDDSILDDTWIIFMGDNGWQTGSHKFTSKVLGYEESIRVPLIVKAPGVASRVESRFALNVDLPAMFYAIAGLQLPSHVQGKNLRALVENPDVPWREQVYIESLKTPLGAEPYDALRTREYKFIRTYESEDGAMKNTGILYEELYDLAADPNEMINLADRADHAAIKATMAERLEAEKAAIASTPDP